MFLGKKSNFSRSIISQRWKGRKLKVRPFTFECNGQQASF